jgi:hypothetical protein
MKGLQGKRRRSPERTSTGAASPQHFRQFHARPVSGLASLAAPPSRIEIQWRTGAAALAYRCGGSSGIATCVAHRFPVSPRQGFLPAAPNVKRLVVRRSGADYTAPNLASGAARPANCATKYIQKPRLVLDRKTF